MCTLTIIPTRHGFRASMNRDELKSRPASLAPIITAIAGRRALMPVDAASLGTWFAVNDAGLLLALLNLNLTPGPTLPSDLTSRGLLIPRLLAHDTAVDAILHAQSLPIVNHAPFRLIVADGAGIFELSAGHGITPSLNRHSIESPAFFTSSGLGDALVQEPRQALFRKLLCSSFPSPLTQDYFHSHRWPARSHLSIWMDRQNAKTVSFTTIDVSPAGAQMAHRLEHPTSHPFTLSLPIRAQLHASLGTST